MSLRLRIIFILALVLALYATLDLAIQHWVVVPSFAALERDGAAKDLRRCLDALHREIREVDLLCMEWAAREEFYAFASGPSPDFEQRYLTPSRYKEMDITSLYVVDLAGRLVWGRSYDADSGQPMDFAEFPAAAWDPKSALMRYADPERPLSGVVLTSRGAMLLSSHPITGPAGTGKAAIGTLIAGHLLGAHAIEAIGEEMGIELQAWPLSAAKLPPDLEAVRARLTPSSPCYFREHGSRVLELYTTFPDVFGDQALLIGASIPREITAKGALALYFARLSILVLAFLIFLLVFVSLRVAVIDPVRMLTRHVTRVNKGDDLALIALPPREDELTTLTREFNRMVQRLQADNAQRQRAEQALREKEARLRAIVETAPAGIMTFDEHGAIESFNPAAEQLFGYTASEAKCLRVQDLVTMDGGGDAPGAFLPSGSEGLGCRKDGGRFAVHWTMSETPFGEGRLFTGIVRDITDLREMHDKVLQAEHLAALGEMGASVAHEIRNPLAGISGAIQVLRNGLAADDKRRAIMDEIVEQVARVDTIVNRLLLFAKTWTPVKQRVNLRDLVARVSEEARAQEPGMALEIRFEGDPALEASVDPALFEQVLWNIIKNAKDAMRAASGETPRRPCELRWTFARTEHGARVALRDTGCGMNPSVQAHLYRPFFTTKTYGTGLGLAICRRIVEAHGGTIHMTSAPGEGAEVILEFPDEG